MRLIDADALIEEVQDWVDPFVITFINNAPTVKPCVNCDLYFIAKTKEEMRKGGAE